MPVKKMIGRKTPVYIDDVVSMYVRQHLTLRQIGAIVGISHVGVSKALARAGVTAAQGEHVEVTCSQCGCVFTKTRSTWKNHIDHYCTQQCYAASLFNPAYNQNRGGCLRARAVVAKLFDLRPSHVVHHHDSDNTNNDPSNLAVFACGGDHTSYHRGGGGKMIWDGRKL